MVSINCGGNCPQKRNNCQPSLTEVTARCIILENGVFCWSERISDSQNHPTIVILVPTGHGRELADRTEPTLNSRAHDCLVCYHRGPRWSQGSPQLTTGCPSAHRKAQLAALRLRLTANLGLVSRGAWLPTERSFFVFRWPSTVSPWAMSTGSLSCPKQFFTIRGPVVHISGGQVCNRGSRLVQGFPS